MSEAYKKVAGASATAAPSPAAAPAVPAPAAPAAAAPDEGPLISFHCKACGQEIETTIAMIGTPNECPTCGEALRVPVLSEPGTVWYRERTPVGKRPEPDANTLAQMKSRTIRIELPDEG